MLLAVLYVIAVQLAFNGGTILDLVDPLVALTFATLGSLAVLYLAETIERERVRGLFARFVPVSVVDQVLARTDENLRLGAVERLSTVLFSDLRGFTAFSEGQHPQRVLDVVNFYLSEMTAAILEAGGTLIAYMGDGIMALFGAPLEQRDHADRALAAAREMLGPRLERFNQWMIEQGYPSGFRMGIGLHSGLVMAGNVGSDERLDYTAIGDTTNTASRLEGMTKGEPYMLFISNATRDHLTDPPNDLVFVGEYEVRGRTEKIAVWSIAPAAVDVGVPVGERAGRPRRSRLLDEHAVPGVDVHAPVRAQVGDADDVAIYRDPGAVAVVGCQPLGPAHASRGRAALGGEVAVGVGEQLAPGAASRARGHDRERCVLALTNDRTALEVAADKLERHASVAGLSDEELALRRSSRSSCRRPGARRRP